MDNKDIFMLIGYITTIIIIAAIPLTIIKIKHYKRTHKK